MPEKDDKLHIRINGALKARAQLAAEGNYQTLADAIAMLLEAYCKQYEKEQRKLAKREGREAAE